MNRSKTILALFAMLALLVTTRAFAMTILHAFTPSREDGGLPYGSLTLNGSILYGMASFGGTQGGGTLFAFNADGSGYSTLHSFGDFREPSSGLGIKPVGNVTVDGSVLYGMTGSTGYSGAIRCAGTVFRVNADGTGFAFLHAFPIKGAEGFSPMGSLAIGGSTLYGMTPATDSYPFFGTLFKINTDGSGLGVMHRFGDYGMSPYGSPILSGSTLYGMTSSGGQGGGVVFKVDTDGTDFGYLHSFEASANPRGSLLLDGTNLYGMTWHGGSSGKGSVFKINTDGTDYQTLHSFTGGGADGAYPYDSLILDGSTLYGMTSAGGASGLGTVFSIGTDGGDFALLHSFAGGSSDGAEPHGGLTLVGSTLYGMTLRGGAADSGTVFSLPVPEPSTLALLGIAAGLCALGWRRKPPDVGGAHYSAGSTSRDGARNAEAVS